MQIRLRTIFIAFIGIAFCFALLHYVRRDSAISNRALERLERTGVEITVDLGFPTTYKLFSFPRPVTRENLQDINAVGSVTVLCLSDTELTDTKLSQLKPSRCVRALFLDRNQISDQSVPYLCGLKSLLLLDIQGTRISSEGMSRIVQSLPQCKIISSSQQQEIKLPRAAP